MSAEKNPQDIKLSLDVVKCEGAAMGPILPLIVSVNKMPSEPYHLTVVKAEVLGRGPCLIVAADYDREEHDARDRMYIIPIVELLHRVVHDFEGSECKEGHKRGGDDFTIDRLRRN